MLFSKAVSRDCQRWTTHFENMIAGTLQLFRSTVLFPPLIKLGGKSLAGPLRFETQPNKKDLPQMQISKLLFPPKNPFSFENCI